MSSHPDTVPASTQLQLLKSIVDLTRHPDRRAMEKGLIAALATHTPSTKVTLIQRPFSAGTPLEALIELDVKIFRQDPESGWRFGVEVDHYHRLITRALTDAKAQVDEEAGVCISCIPIVEGAKASGAILLHYPADSIVAFDLVEALLNIYQNYLNILRESESDKLTGLLNRRTFDGKFQHLVAQQSQQAKSSFTEKESQQRHQQRQNHSWLGIIDIDHFKTINDEYGHIYGDEILLLLSQQMQGFFRRADLLFRFGGEEFVVLLEPTDESGADIAFSRFVSRIADYRFPQVGQVTISVGFAPIYTDSVSTDVFGRADQALYYAKRHGRNQVASYLELLSNGSLSTTTKQKDIDLF
ncbi:MAG: GGDEF domain-containing protein [Cellvibrionaceae bacterium]